MESWVPLLDIFMNSPCPETEASQWLQKSFNPSSNITSISTSSFLSLITKPTDAIIADSSRSSSSSSSHSSIPQRKRFMWLQTLPDALQARILSFLAYDHARFNKQDLCKLARGILNETHEQHFWVIKAARQLLDVVSDSSYEWVSGLNLDSEEDKVEGKFGSVPDWLKDAAAANEPLLPWLPISADELTMRMPLVTCEEDEDMMIEAEDAEDRNFKDVDTQHKLVPSEVDPIGNEVEETAAFLKTRLRNLESVLNASGLADEIRQLCNERGGDTLTVLGLIEPWNASDDIVPILLSHLLDGKEEVSWTSNILCSIVLPKLLVLEKPASRVLVTATIEYCKVHHKAAVCALLFPLILRKGGINNPICDVMTRIIRECLHPAHVSAFCQKLLCQEEDGNRYICLPCHLSLVSKELVWTEPLFNLFQNILNHNVHLTQDSVDQLVCGIQESAARFSKSLKFANFLLCLVSKCAPLLKGHKLALTEAVGNTTTFLTKSILSKLASI